MDRNALLSCDVRLKQDFARPHVVASLDHDATAVPNRLAPIRRAIRFGIELRGSGPDSAVLFARR